MKYAVISFTGNGANLALKVKRKLDGNGHVCDAFAHEKYAGGELAAFGDLHAWMENAFSSCDALIFIGACGIAVRSLAPFVKDKFSDPAVLVMDERENWIIPVLSGHVGGANAVALELERQCGAVAVLTSATDVNGKFAVDVWAKQQSLILSGRKEAKLVSAALLSEEKVGFISDFEIDGKLPDGLERTDRTDFDTGICVTYDAAKAVKFRHTLYLIPNDLVLGIGCRKNTPAGEIERAVLDVLEDYRINIRAVRKICSADIKAREEGLLQFSAQRHIPFITFEAAELNAVRGNFSGSDFVKNITGTDNVCERAAVLGSDMGELIIKKTCAGGVTVAAAKMTRRISF